jgi:Tfp pilus assembly protein PilO
MKYLLPIILILASVGLFFLYINPNYLSVKDMRTQQSSFNEALDNSKKLQAARDTLVEKYNAFSPNSVERLSKLLPDNVDNIKLVLEIDRVATQYGMQVKNIKYDLSKKDAPVASNQFAAQAPQAKKDYGDFELEFSVEGSYANFVSFLTSLENSLRIVDLESISFSSADAGVAGGAAKGTYKYDFKIKTYWLKG